MKNIFLLLSFFTIISCNNCVDERVARVTKVESIVYEAGMTARM